MLWSRLYLYLLPALLTFCVGWVAVEVSKGRTAQECEITALLPDGPALTLHPYSPACEVDAQIVDLVHQPLISLDASGHLAPAIAREWEWSKTVSLWFASESQARLALTAIEAVKAQQWTAWRLLQASIIGEMLRLDFSAPQQAGSVEAVHLLAACKPQLLTMLHLLPVKGSSITSVLAEPSLAQRIVREWHGKDGAIEIAIRAESSAFAHDLGELCAARNLPRPVLRSLASLLALDEPVLTFNLDPAARWQDGSPVTAADVQQTYLGLRQRPWLPPAQKAGWLCIDRIESPRHEQDTVRVVYRVPYGPALCDWIGLPILPAAWWLAHPDPTDAAAFVHSPPPGAGPMHIEQRASSALILRPATHPQREDLLRVSFLRHYSAFSTHLGAATGALDALWPGDASMVNLPRREEFRLLPTPPHTQTTVLWNTRQGPLALRPVREAIALGTDRAALVNDIARGCATPFSGLFAPGIWLSSKPAIPAIDTTKGEARLTQAGYLKGINGLATRPDSPLIVELLYDASRPTHAALATALAKQWLALGITTSIVPLPDALALAERLAKRRFDAVLTTHDLRSSWDQLDDWHTSHDTVEGQNFTGLHDRQIDLLLEALRQEFDPKAAASRAQKLEAAILAQHPTLPLFCSYQPLALRRSKAPASRADSAPWTLRQAFLSRQPGKEAPAP